MAAEYLSTRDRLARDRVPGCTVTVSPQFMAAWGRDRRELLVQGAVQRELTSAQLRRRQLEGRA